MDKLQNKLKEINKKFPLNDSADESAYKEIKVQMEKEFTQIKMELEGLPEKVSNQESLVDKA